MTEQWQELKETIKELRYSNGDLTQQEVCSFLGVYMETLEKQIQQPIDAKETIIKSVLKYLVQRQIEEGSVGFAVDNDHDHDCCWDDVLAWIEAQPSENYISREAVETFKEELIDKLAYTGYTEEYKNEIIDIINQMPSVYPKRPKGKWIIVDDCEHFIAKCSECGEIVDSRMINNYPYCHCGAEMNGGGEE